MDAKASPLRLSLPEPLSQPGPCQLALSPASIQVSPVLQDSDRSLPWLSGRGPLSPTLTTRSSYPCAVGPEGLRSEAATSSMARHTAAL